MTDVVSTSQEKHLDVIGQGRAPMGSWRGFHFFFFLLPSALLVIDLALMGPGTWSDALGVSVRKLAFLLVAAYTAAVWIVSVDMRENRFPPAFGGSFLILGFLAIWGGIIPWLRSRGLGDALSDGQLFVGLLFAPAIAQLLIRTKTWPSALRWIEVLLYVLAVFHVLIYGWYNLSGDGAQSLIAAIRSVMEPGRSVEDTSIYIGMISDGFRVFWGSSVFLLLGFYLALKNYRNRPFVWTISAMFIFAYAISLTLTRAMQLAVPLMLILSWFFGRWLIYARLGIVSYSLIGLALLLITVPIVLLADPTLLQAIGLGRAISDDLRYEQAQALIDSIITYPWFGGGLGASAAVIRSEGAPWSYELSMLALYMKLGLVGSIFLGLIFVIFVRNEMPAEFISRLRGEDRSDLAKILALLFCIVFCSNTNPYLFSMLGWGLLMFVYVEYATVCRRITSRVAI